MTMPTMPIEFSVAAYRFGHSMVRAAYDWNAVFNTWGRNARSVVRLLGYLGLPRAVGDNALPSNWIADWRRLYPFASIGRPDSNPRRGVQPRAANRHETAANPLPGTTAGRLRRLGRRPAAPWRPTSRSGTSPGPAWSSSQRGSRWRRSCASKGVRPDAALTANQIAGAGNGAVLDDLSPNQRARFVSETPLLVLRPA